MESMNRGTFVKGTDYRSIPYHETWHILTKTDPKLAVKVEGIVRQRAQELGMTIEDYIKQNVSNYAANINPFGRGDYQELLPELFSLWYNQPNKTGEQMLLLSKIWEVL